MMLTTKRSLIIGLGIAATLTLSACAGTSSFLQQPEVQLASVRVGEMNLRQQTFLLGFNVDNPNPYPLPIKAVRYKVRLNDHNFAGGETASDFTVPANGHESFVISVDLDLLQSGMQLASIIRSGAKRDLSYQVFGDLSLGLPTTPTVNFSSSGTVAIESELF